MTALTQLNHAVPLPLRRSLRSLLFRFSWLGAIAAERKRHAGTLPELVADAKCVVIFSMVPWHHGTVEYCLGENLRSRGHRVHGIFCGGSYPVCGMESSVVTRPDCADCMANARRFMTAFGVQHESTSTWLGPRDREEASEIAGSLSPQSLANFCYDGVELGKNTLRDLNQYYHRVVADFRDPEVFEKAKSFVASGILNARLASRIFESLKPDVVIISNGKSIAYAAIFESARRCGIETVTWDESPTFRDGFTFNRNTYANEIHLEDVWRDPRNQSISDEQLTQVRDYFGGWRTGRNARYQYHHDPITHRTQVVEDLALPTQSRIITFFSNLTWETSHLGRDVGFSHLIESVNFLVEYAKSHPDYTLIIRAHPAEVKVPDELKTVVPLEQLITMREPHLPDNIRIISGESSISSYTLARISDLRVVYTTTMGLEFALEGLNTLVLGDSHFRNKGFTTDVTSPGHLREILSHPQEHQTITKEQMRLAYAYAYLWIFRHVVRIPYLDTETRRKYTIQQYSDLFAGSGSVIDKLGEEIIESKDFIDIHSVFESESSK